MAELMAIDIETYSDVSLPDCGVHRYASSPQFEILLFAYSIDDGEIAVVDLASGEEMPEEVMECLKDGSVIKTAFNAAFERTCINRFFHLDLQPESWHCTAVQASMLSLPLSLEGVGENDGGEGTDPLFLYPLQADQEQRRQGKEPAVPRAREVGAVQNLLHSGCGGGDADQEKAAEVPDPR